ncbi:hypothetical protein Tco_0909494 [Tanacetum coccineum]|uniref:Reverse transcriptase domain-containing protein n=1 Tax=Tanacetum coccineum TaxID=301880 RepID=A0ABQ5CWH1_9ASTR
MQIETNKLNNQMANLTDMLAKFVTANTASTSGSGTLPGNTVTNPREDLKGITTRSGVAYQGLPIPTSSVVKPIPELLRFSQLATMDPPRDIMVQTSPPKRSLTPVSSGPLVRMRSAVKWGYTLCVGQATTGRPDLMIVGAAKIQSLNESVSTQEDLTAGYIYSEKKISSQGLLCDANWKDGFIL